MKPFMDQDFLLHSDVARRLYHKAAETMPILDYHCHISPKEIAEDRHFDNITSLWLGGDHYKWRFMRACGVEERFITGMLRIRKNSSNGQRFLAEQSAIHSITGVIWNYSVTLTITAF